MDCPALAGLSLRASAIVIAVVGMLHWLACALPARRFRSELFVLLYLLAAAAGLVSCLLLAGILGNLAWAYWLWTWYTLVYACTMIVALVIVAIGFFNMEMRRLTLFPVIGLLYYILTLYFICVVNTQRRSAQGPSPQDMHAGASAGAVADASAGALAGAARHGTRAGTNYSVSSTLEAITSVITTRATTTTTSAPPFGRCWIPALDPPHGQYHAALPDNQQAERGRTYLRLRLWVSCERHYRPRRMPHALCFSGGWNRPLPDCVRDQPSDEEYIHYDYDEDEWESTTPAEEGVCVMPRPPLNGYFTLDAETSKRHVSLVVRCNPMHYVVGWQHVSCWDGLWNRPMPKCLFIDTAVCALLKRSDTMTRTCLPGEHYSAAYRCDTGLVPHGTIVEARCPRDYYVLGPFTYMHCIDGEWHPRTASWRSLVCRHAADIYHYYKSSIRPTLPTTTADGELGEADDAADTNSPNDTVGEIKLLYRTNKSSGEDSNKTRTRTTIRPATKTSSIQKNFCYTQKGVKSNGVGSNTGTNVSNICNSENRAYGGRLKTKSKKISIWKPQMTLSTSGTSRSSLSRRRIWTTQSESRSVDYSYNTTHISIWKTQRLPNE